MTTALASALRAKQKADKLSITALSKTIGANVQSVAAALKGKSVPNKTTAPKFAKFLGISLEEFQAMVKPTAKAAKPGKKAKKMRKARKVAKSVAAKAVTKPSKGVTLAEAVELAADVLAVSVHRASAEQRRIITAVLGA